VCVCVCVFHMKKELEITSKWFLKKKERERRDKAKSFYIIILKTNTLLIGMTTHFEECI